MDDVSGAARAAREWEERIDRAEAEQVSGAAMPIDAPPGRRLRQAIETARGIVAALGRGEQAIPAEFAGVRSERSPLERWAHGAPSAPPAQRGRARGAEWRDAAPTQALIEARQARDAVLRLATWSLLGDAHAATPSEALQAVVTAACRRASGVPPGIAPTLGYAGTDDAHTFFNSHLRAALERLARPHARAPAAPPPMDGTAALAQRWSGAWTDAVCAVYADWLQRRSSDSIPAARASLWHFTPRECPVRFRPANGLAVIPTKGFRLHVDLWLSPLVAQVLAFDAARWRREPVDGRWHPVRLAVHDLAARDVGDSPDRSRTLFRGLTVEMLYQAVFVERLAAAFAPRAVAQPGSRDPDGAAGPAGVPQAIGGVLAAAKAPLDAGSGRMLRRREVDGLPPLALDEGQREVLAAWLASEPAAAADAQPAELDWQRPERDASAVDGPLVPLGHADLWSAAGDEAAWIEVAGCARVAAGWVDLPLQLVDVPGGRRHWLALHRDDAAAAGLDAARLRERLAAPAQRSTSLRHDGFGAFVALAVDLR